MHKVGPCALHLACPRPRGAHERERHARGQQRPLVDIQHPTPILGCSPGPEMFSALWTLQPKLQQSLKNQKPGLSRTAMKDYAVGGILTALPSSPPEAVAKDSEFWWKAQIVRLYHAACVPPTLSTLAPSARFCAMAPMHHIAGLWHADPCPGGHVPGPRTFASRLSLQRSRARESPRPWAVSGTAMKDYPVCGILTRLRSAPPEAVAEEGELLWKAQTVRLYHAGEPHSSTHHHSCHSTHRPTPSC
jgi:hypothetical protein